MLSRALTGTKAHACVHDLQVAFAWAISIEPEEGTQLLLKLGLLDPALDYALESGAFAQAFQLCRAPAAQHKMSDCHLKYAMHLEDEGKWYRNCRFSLNCHIEDCVHWVLNDYAHLDNVLCIQLPLFCAFMHLIVTTIGAVVTVLEGFRNSIITLNQAS